MNNTILCKINPISEPIIVFLEHISILDRLYLHRFLIAQAREFVSFKAKVFFCTADDPASLQNEFLDKYIPESIAISKNDSKLLRQIEPKIVFISSVITGCKLAVSNPFKNRNFESILWYQGVIPEESYLRRKSNLRRYVLLILERIALTCANIVIVPTQSMLDYLESNNRLPKKTQYLVVPNAIDSLPPLVSDPKHSWGIKENNFPIIGYCGGLSKWQCFEQILDFVENIQRIEPDTIFLVLTYDQHKASEMILKKGLANTIVKQTSPDDVYRYIQSFDVGILFRDESAVNTVAFPLKYLDYISNGVPVITTNAVKSILNDVLANYGYIVDLDNMDYSSILEYIKRIASQKSLICQKLRDDAVSKWTFSVVNAKIKNIYLEIMNRNP